jgi:hydrogenase-4 membrane subunit HyfE
MTWLEKVRLVLALAGLAFLIAGTATDSRLIVWGAIVLLGLAFIVRVYLRKKVGSQSN